MAFIRLTWPNCTASLHLRSSIITVLLTGVMVAAIPIPTKSDFEGRARYSKQEIRRAVTFYAKRYRLHPALLRAVIKAESDFRQDAVSHKGAIGLMQLTPDTAATLRVADIYDPLQNIRGGARQLRHLLNLYEDDVPLTLAAYNAGVHRVKRGKIPRIRETRSYVRKVLSYYERYRMPRQRRKPADLSSPSKSGFAPKEAKRGRVRTEPLRLGDLKREELIRGRTGASLEQAIRPVETDRCGGADLSAHDSRTSVVRESCGLRPHLHDQSSKTFPLGESNTGELQTK